MKAIAVIDQNLALGNKGALLFHLPADLKHFKNETLGKTIIMGRTTVEGLPGGKPLPGRTTLIMSRANPPQSIPGDAIVCGGAQIYRLFYEQTDELILTEVEAKAPEADAYFPDFRDDFELISEEGPFNDGPFPYYFRNYKRKQN